MIGWAAAQVMTAEGPVGLIENVLVGVFGAFIGGDFLVAMLNGGVVSTKFTVLALGMAAGGAIVMLLALRLLRGAVGPLRPSRKTGAKRP